MESGRSLGIAGMEKELRPASSPGSPVEDPIEVVEVEAPVIANNIFSVS